MKTVLILLTKKNLKFNKTINYFILIKHICILHLLVFKLNVLLGLITTFTCKRRRFLAATCVATKTLRWFGNYGVYFMYI